MEITEIDLDFLWDKYPLIFDAPNPYDIKWDNEIDKLDLFLIEEPLNKVLEVVIIAFKDKYPRALFLYGALSVGFHSETIEEGDYIGINQKDIKRNDILKYRNKFYTDTEDLEFAIEMILEYLPTPAAIEYVEKGLHGKIYTKVELDNKTVFKVQDSPISEIEVSATKFHLKIDKEKVVYRI